MLRYRRMPALIILAVLALLGTGYVLAWDQVERFWKKSGDQSIEILEKKIKEGDRSVQTWLDYAQALTRAGNHAAAADAWKQVIKLEPGRKDAKFQCALCLAHAARGDQLHAFLNEMVLIEPKLVMEILERPETNSFMAEDRFAALKMEAKNQAMD